MSSAIFAQNSSSTKNSKAELSGEFGNAPIGQIRSEMDSFLLELQNNPASQGYVINYGTNKDISAREKLFRNHLIFRKFDSSKIVIVRGGFREAVKTELWVVHSGAEMPEIKSELNKIDEFGEVANGVIKARLDSFFVELQDHSNKKGYVIINGPAKTVLRRERFIRNYILMRRFDSSRIKLINDGFNDEIKTELWIEL